MLDVEIEGRDLAPDAPDDATIERALTAAFAARGIMSGHVAVHFVDEARSHELAAEYLGKDDATDVISFPVDGEDGDLFPAGPDDADEDGASDGGGLDGAEHPASGPGDDGPPRELGDIVICPPRTVDILETVVHGALHLTGMDHEVDDGEMLALQDELMERLTR